MGGLIMIYRWQCSSSQTNISLCLCNNKNNNFTTHNVMAPTTSQPSNSQQPPALLHSQSLVFWWPEFWTHYQVPSCRYGSTFFKTVIANSMRPKLDLSVTSLLSLRENPPLSTDSSGSWQSTSGSQFNVLRYLNTTTRPPHPPEVSSVYCVLSHILPCFSIVFSVYDVRVFSRLHSCFCS